MYAVEDLAGISTQNLAQQSCSRCGIGNLAGHGEDGIHRDRHSQRVAIAVVDDSALGSDIDGALLLALSPLDVITVLEYLQAEKAAADDQQPQNKDSCEEVEPPLG